MLREWATVIVVVALCPGCSLILNFDSSQIPKDAMIDGPFTADQCNYDEPNDTFDTAATITPGVDMGPAAICPTTTGTDDLDDYKFTVPAGTTSVAIAIQFTERTGGDLDLELYDSTGTAMLAQSRGFGSGETITCPAPSPPCAALAAGDYIFQVLPGVSGDVNSYTFSVTLQ